MQISVIERAQQIQIQDQEIIRRERELEATVKKPAEAEKYRLEKIADANRFVTLLRELFRRSLFRPKQHTNEMLRLRSL